MARGTYLSEKVFWAVLIDIFQYYFNQNNSFMTAQLKKALKDVTAFKHFNEARLKLGQTKVCLDADGEVSYSAPQKQLPGSAAVFKPLPEMMMKSLADAIAHSALKKRITDEVASEKSAAGSAERHQDLSSSEDLYSQEGNAYELPQIDPDQLKIATDE